MINHISITGILCEIENQESIYRNIKIKRNYKDVTGRYIEDIIPCMMWSRNNKNKLFSFKTNSYVALDGRIERDENGIHIVVEQIMYLASQEVKYVSKEGV